MKLSKRETFITSIILLGALYTLDGFFKDSHLVSVATDTREPIKKLTIPTPDETLNSSKQQANPTVGESQATITTTNVPEMTRLSSDPIMNPTLNQSTTPSLQSQNKKGETLKKELENLKQEFSEKPTEELFLTILLKLMRLSKTDNHERTERQLEIERILTELLRKEKISKEKYDNYHYYLRLNLK